MKYALLALWGLATAAGLAWIEIPPSLEAASFDSSLATDNCFFYGSAPFIRPDLHPEYKGKNNMIRRRFEARNESECKDFIIRYCKQEIVEDQRVVNLRGHFKLKSPDGDPEKTRIVRFKLDQYCLVRPSSGE